MEFIRIAISVLRHGSLDNNTLGTSIRQIWAKTHSYDGSRRCIFVDDLIRPIKDILAACGQVSISYPSIDVEA